VWIVLAAAIALGATWMSRPPDPDDSRAAGKPLSIEVTVGNVRIEAGTSRR
jgi:hypothetical protein